MRKRAPLPIFVSFLFDALAVCFMLGVFMLIRQQLLVSDLGLNQNILLHENTPAPEPTPSLPELSPAYTATPEAMPTTPTPSPSPTPEPGDFSATFPDYDTSQGIDALHSYQTDDMRIIVYSGYRDEATYYVADVWVRNFRMFQTGFADKRYRPGYVGQLTPIIAEAYGAIVAISGDYYSQKGVGLVIRNGTLYRDSIVADVCVLYTDGVMESYFQKDADIEAIIARGAYQAWSFGPKLLDHGEAPAAYRSENAGRNPRAAVGYFEPGHYCLVVIDGRQGAYSRGMTYPQMSQLFISLGCVDAYNLDGGQTAMMVFLGEVVNRPYRNGRTVSDILFF